MAIVTAVASVAMISAAPVEIDWSATVIEERFIPSETSQEARAVALWLDLTPGSSWVMHTESQGHRTIEEVGGSTAAAQMTTSTDDIFRVIDVSPEGLARLEWTTVFLSNRALDDGEWYELVDSPIWPGNPEPCTLTMNPRGYMTGVPSEIHLPWGALSQMRRAVLTPVRGGICLQPVRPGDRWTRSAHIEGFEGIHATCTSTLASVEEGGGHPVAVIECDFEFAVEISWPMGRSSVEGTLVDTTLEAHHEEGRITRRLDLAQGRFLDGRGITDMHSRATDESVEMDNQIPGPSAYVMHDHVELSEVFTRGE